MARPKGIPRAGVYGTGIKTEVVRVPLGKRDLVQRLLIELPPLVQRWDEQSRDTRSWSKANEILNELERLFPELFSPEAETSTQLEADSLESNPE